VSSPYSKIGKGRAGGRALAVLLTLGLLFCLGHGLQATPGDDHAALHAPCAPVAALMAAGVLLALLAGAGWLITTASPALVAVSLHLPDPPPKRPARS
jgi:hypothetical protein